MTAWLTVPELAALLGVAQSWVYEGTASRRLPHHRVGRYVRFSPADVDRIGHATAVEPTRAPRLRSTAQRETA